MAVDAEPARDLAWEGCFNVRDLGGLRMRDGGRTRFGAIVRSDNPGRLTETGVATMRAHGIRTIVDLRHESELERGNPVLEVELDVVAAPVVDFGDAEFWSRWRGKRDTPRFYQELLERWPERFAAAVAAVAHAPKGGVLVHCEVGRDRTGLVCALLLSLADVPPEEIAADYALSASRLEPLYEALLAQELDPDYRARLAAENVSDAASMTTVLARLDVRGYLAAAGVSERALDAVRERLR